MFRHHFYTSFIWCSLYRAVIVAVKHISTLHHLYGVAFIIGVRHQSSLFLVTEHHLSDVIFPFLLQLYVFRNVSCY